MILQCGRTLLLAFVLTSSHAAHAAAMPDDWTSPSLDERIVHLPVIGTDRFGNHSEGLIPITVYKPAGTGPFPLVVLNHGRITGYEGRSWPRRYRMEVAARYFLRKGFVVAVPTRLGYGETVDAGDPEDSSDWCEYQDTSGIFRNGGAQIAAVVARMQTESWVARDQVVLLGISVGGLTVLDATTRDIPGLKATINFAGGRGGSPGSHPAKPCVPQELHLPLARLGRDARAPSLWLYLENDLFFGPEVARYWFEAYRSLGGPAELRMLPARLDDGHDFFGLGNDHWQAMLDEYLARFGFTAPGAQRLPPPTAYARIDDFDALVPVVNEEGQAIFRQYRNMGLPRAFAIGPNGVWGMAWQDAVQDNAVMSCERKGNRPCRLYAVDDRIVW